MKREDYKTITADGSTVTTGVASARIALPVNAAGNKPRYIVVTGTVESYVRLGDVTVVATANSLLIQPADSRHLVVGGCTHIAHIQGTTVGKVNIIPLDDE